VRRAIADDTFDDYERRAAVVREEVAVCLVERREVIRIIDAQHVPAKAAEAGGDIFVTSQVGFAFDGDVIVVVDPTEVGKLEMSGDGGRFVRDAFHEVAVATLGPDAEVEQLEARLVVACREPARGDRHPDAVAAALAEWASSRFDAACVL